MKSSLKIGSFLGVPIKLHITFLIILPFLAYAFSVYPPPMGFSGIQDPVLRYGLGAIAAIMLFASVLVHEMGHTFVALRNGIKIGDITLFLFGGVSNMEEIPRNPGIELRLAIIGPLISIVLGIIFGAAYLTLPSLHGTATGIMLFLLAYMNVALGLFNILPAFPMDGGRVFRSILAMRMPYMKATRYAVGVGRLFAYLLGIIGLFMGWGGIWLIIIALFIYVAAGEEERSTMVSITLEGIKVRDVMTKDVVTMDVNTTVKEAIDTMFRMKHLGYPVMSEGKMAGIVALSDVSKVPVEKRDTVTVKEVMTDKVITVKPDDDAFTALQALTKNHIGRLVVIDGDRIAGIITRTDLLRSLEIAETAKGG